MSKRAQYKDYMYRRSDVSVPVDISLQEFVPDCDDCGVPMPEWDEDPEMHVQCDNCNSNNEG
jgi:hypothetical protein